ncbi:uncharacterized protein LOC115385180 [Salarias fasciatus]|uniref:Uncharacterized LOC115385180 n=1 Tax=Salarias fasciatus TaxID=181472 RepID=A0A672G8K2_SALFA|nr:uncharacterized protein LOC115385180 [Salarias fasciatus]
MKPPLKVLPLVVLSCLIFSTHSKPGGVLPPQNVSYEWIDDFMLRLSWNPPQHPVTNCKYLVSTESKSHGIETYTEPYMETFVVMEGGSIPWNIATVCNGSESEPAVFNLSYPELVKNFTCTLYSGRNTHCQWSADGHSSDFKFYYGLADECSDDNPPLHLQECSSYTLTNGVKSGCELKATWCHVLFALFTATVGNQPVRNTFKRALKDNEILDMEGKWNVMQNGSKFTISWDLSAASRRWAIEIKYTECGETHKSLHRNGVSYELELLPHCQKSFAIRAVKGTWASPWSDWKHYGPVPDEGPNALVYVAFAVPLLMAFVVVLSCVCFQRNKETLLPKVPEPVDYLSEFANNNNKSAFHNHYIPEKEEDSCRILLVLDPQLGKGNC